MTNDENTFLIQSHFYHDALVESDLPEEHDELETLSADQAMFILRSEKQLYCKRVRGDVILAPSDMEPPTDITLTDGNKATPFQITSAHHSSKNNIDHSIDIRGCIFEDKFILSGSWFEKPLTIASTRFIQHVDISKSVFMKALVFYNAHFQSSTFWGDSLFFGSAAYARSAFHGTADFYNNVYKEGVNFSNAIFDKGFNLGHCSFDSKLIFYPCLNFSGVLSLGAALFPNASFNGIANFTNARFHDRTVFDGAEIAYICFRGAQFSIINLSWEQICGGKLLFGDVNLNIDELPSSLTTFAAEKIFHDCRIDYSIVEKQRQYDILKRLFEKQGDYVSADGCFYEWKQTERRQTPLGLNPFNWIKKVFHYMNWLICGYGVLPIRALLFSIIIIVLFGLGYSLDDIMINHLEDVNEVTMILMVNLKYSLLSFMNFASEIHLTSRVDSTLSVIERLLGGFTLLLFVTTYTRIMLR